jgi:hypothetical protein
MKSKQPVNTKCMVLIKVLLFDFLFAVCFFLGIWILGFGILSVYAVPVYTDTTYPVITVTDTAEYYKVTINDLEGDSLFDIAYAWGTRPNVYTAVSVAYDDTANWQFSHAESLRWEYIQQKVVERWDQATYRKHPLNFTFLEYPMLLNQSKYEIENAAGKIASMHMFYFNKIEELYTDSIKNPYLYV